MTREREEIAIEVAHIDGKMRHRLGAVDDHRRAELVRDLSHELHVVSDAENVRDVDRRDDLGTRAYLGAHLLFAHGTLTVGIHINQLRAGGTARLLPGNQVRMMLHDRDAHLVTWLEHRRRERMRQQIERLGGVTAEHDVMRVFLAVEPDEARDMRPRCVNRLGSLHRQAVEPAQGIRVHRLVEALLRVEHCLRALRRRRAVEEREVGFRREQREVFLVRRFGQRRCLGVACIPLCTASFGQHVRAMQGAFGHATPPLRTMRQNREPRSRRAARRWRALHHRGRRWPPAR